MPAPSDPPRPPSGLLTSSQAAWADLWASPLGSLLLDTDRPAIARLFGLRDERARLWRAAQANRVVAGGRGQPRPNPLYTLVASFDAEIRQLEDRVGLTPRARLQLGITLGDASRSLGDLASMGTDDADDAAAADDMRAAFATADPIQPSQAERSS